MDLLATTISATPADTTAGLPYRGTTTDIAGRPGLAFQVTADGSTSTLLIHAATGEPLAAKEWIDSARRPGLFAYVLILNSGRTSSTDSPPSPATAAAATHLR